MPPATTHTALSGRKLIRAILVSLAISGAAFLYGAWAWRSVDGFLAAIDRNDTLFGDFARHYYPMGRELFATHAPVRGFFYSPLFALLLTPLGALPLPAARLLWGALQVLTGLLLFLIPGAHFLRRSEVECYSYVAALSLSFPLWHNFGWGQLSVWVALCILAAFFCHQRGRVVLAAVLLALACATKYYAAVFLVYFALKRDVRFLAAFALAAVLCLAVIPALALGLDGTMHFYRLSQVALAEAQSWMRVDLNSQYVASVITRVSYRTWGAELDPMFASVVGWAVFVLNVFCVHRCVQRGGREGAGRALVLLLLSLPLVVETSWPHYFVYLPFCQVLLAGALWRGAVGPARAVGLAAAGLSAFLSSIVCLCAVGGWRAYAGYGLLLVADVLLLVPAYMLVPWRAVRPPESVGAAGR
jgi:alpha-1,2-mannosyltransferase